MLDERHSNGWQNEVTERRFIMGLLERVSTLIRANINDLVDRAEDPEKLIKQVILDMENQYLQVKTQVAVSIADEHMLEKKLRENEDTARDWMRKAEIAVDKLEDDLARAALDRFQTSQRLAQSYREQVDDQRAQVDTLKAALVKLEQKLEEAKSKRDLLLARHRRSLSLGKAAHAQAMLGDNSKSATFDRLKDRVHHSESVATAEVELLTDDMGERITRLDRDAEIDRLLAELKARRGLPEKAG
jgi:phage shock protein A